METGGWIQDDRLSLVLAGCQWTMLLVTTQRRWNHKNFSVNYQSAWAPSCTTHKVSRVNWIRPRSKLFTRTGACARHFEYLIYIYITSDLLSTQLDTYGTFRPVKCWREPPQSGKISRTQRLLRLRSSLEGEGVWGETGGKLTKWGDKLWRDRWCGNSEKLWPPDFA